MILALGLSVAAVAAVAVGLLGMAVFRSKAILALLGVGAFVLVAFVTVAVATSAGESSTMGGFSQEQMEADRMMTQEMAIVTGPGMDVQMASDWMLARSANSAYLRALEQHVYEFDRMLGRVP